VIWITEWRHWIETSGHRNEPAQAPPGRVPGRVARRDPGGGGDGLRSGRIYSRARSISSRCAPFLHSMPPRRHAIATLHTQVTFPPARLTRRLDQEEGGRTRRAHRETPAVNRHDPVDLFVQRGGLPAGTDPHGEAANQHHASHRCPDAALSPARSHHVEYKRDGEHDGGNRSEHQAPRDRQNPIVSSADVTRAANQRRS